MGHDIVGYNQTGVEIAYVRFSMGNRNASLLYSILDANDYDAGVSGSGGSTTFSIKQIENALNAYKEICSKGDPNQSKSNFEIWDQKQIMNFLVNCLETAQKEASVSVFFG